MIAVPEKYALGVSSPTPITDRETTQFTASYLEQLAPEAEKSSDIYLRRKF